MKIIDELNNYARALEKAAKWNGSKEAIANVYDNYDDPDRETNYVYEFYVLISIVNNLTKKYKIVYKPDSLNTHCFPKSSGLKSNYPFFMAFDFLDNSIEKFQICPGIKIINKYGHSIHPDISIQKPGTTLDPTYHDILYIMDAKHKKKSNRITADDVKVFGVDVKSLEIDLTYTSINFSPPFDIFSKNAILTNGQPHLDVDPMLNEYEIEIGFEFYPNLNLRILR